MDMCALSPQEAAFWRAACICLPSNPSPIFPLQHLSISCQGQKMSKKQQGRGETLQQGKNKWEEEKKKERKAGTKQARDFAVPPAPLHQTLQHSSSPSLSPSPPFPFSPSLLANKHALLRTHGVHSKVLSQAPRSHTGTRIHKDSCHSTHSHMFCIPPCLSCLYIAPQCSLGDRFICVVMASPYSTSHTVY